LLPEPIIFEEAIMLQVLMKCLTHLPIPSLVVHNTHANMDIEGSGGANVVTVIRKCSLN